MKLEDFIKVAIRKSVIISNITNLRWSWYKRREYAELTSLVDFECSFDEDGVCKIDQSDKYGSRGGRRNQKYIDNLSKCCCSGCRINVGYLKALPNDIGILINTAEQFDKRTGFWRLGKGCILPRKYRSNTCLFHMCRRLPSKSRRGDPLELLKCMMRTPCISGRPSLHSVLPKTFKHYNPTSVNAINRKWIPSDKMERLLLEDKAKRKAGEKRKSK